MHRSISLVLAAMVLTGFASPAGAQCKVNFNSTASVAVGSSPDGLVAADFNRDGRLDLAVVNKASNNVSILLNQGGSFAVTMTYTVGSAPNTIAAADYNKDGKIDMAVTNGSSNTFTLMRGMGNGEFLVGFTFNTQANPSSVTFADFNLDGNQDIAVLHLNGPTISIFFGDGTGTFVNSANVTLSGGLVAPLTTTSIVVADLNLDGKPDIVAAGKEVEDASYQLVITVLGNGAGGFPTINYYFPLNTPFSETADVKIADVNRDGKPDIISLINRESLGITYFAVGIGNGAGGFTFGPGVPPYAGRARSMATGDFNFDGKVDVVLSQEPASGTSNFYSTTGTDTGGPFAPPASFSTGGGNTQRVIAADLNGDGRPDIASTNSVGNKVNISLNTCGGLKTSPPKVDFDGDGKTDIAIFRPSVGEWWFLNSSNGGYGAAQFGSSSDRPVPGDYTGDGKVDIAFWRPSTGFWFILRSEDYSYYGFPFGINGDVPSTGDYDGDGRTDVAVFRPSTSTWYVLRSSGGTTTTQFGINGDVPAGAD